MGADAAGRALANMSAPPRSRVQLPVLAPAPLADAPANVPVGPGGGARRRGALLVARVDLAPVMQERTGGYPDGIPRPKSLRSVPRWLLTLGRAARAGREVGAESSEWTEVEITSEADLVNELAEHLAAVRWPAWVPPVAVVVRHPAHELAASGAVVPDVLLAARLLSAMRGPVFLRDGMPSVAPFLGDSLRGKAFGAQEIWLPQVSDFSAREARP